jgi:LmbE family N-acetylglucosaminyl deacetylase
MKKTRQELTAAFEAAARPVRGRRAVLDGPAARMHGVTRRRLEATVKRHGRRFGPDGMLTLAPGDARLYASPHCRTYQLPKRAFTLKGVRLLAEVLRGKKARR